MADVVTIMQAPTPEDTADRARWAYLANVRLVLGDAWDGLLKAAIIGAVGETRFEAWPKPDTSHCLISAIADTLAVSYVAAPVVAHPSGDDAIAAELMKIGHWAVMSRVERDIYALREMLLRPDVDPTTGRLSVRVVFPDRVVATADPEAPDRPVSIRELRLRTHPRTGALEWTWDVLSIEDPDRPFYRIELADDSGKAPKGTDRTADYLGTSFVGDAYGYRWADGTPFLPYVLGHAQKTGRLWDSYEWKGIYEGTLTVGTMYTELLHIIHAAGWPQRVSVGLEPVGSQPSDNGRRSEVVTDPASLLMLQPVDGFDGQPMLHQFDSGGDAAALLGVIQSIEQSHVAHAGVPSSDIMRSTGSPQSGYALM
ncbi:MAG: hypothetical protein GY913_19180, partial [Proteobacteria bacterium]|nr:hypothetical protein [Pseudomonadota bacterium]